MGQVQKLVPQPSAVLNYFAAKSNSKILFQDDDGQTADLVRGMMTQTPADLLIILFFQMIG